MEKDYRASIKSAVKAADGDEAALAAALADKDLEFPLFRCVTDAGQNLYVIPVVGSGLWGPIWGYVALEEDMTTIFGANFDHKTGLRAWVPKSRSPSSRISSKAKNWMLKAQPCSAS